MRVAGLELMRSLVGEFNVEDPRNIKASCIYCVVLYPRILVLTLLCHDQIDQFAQERRSPFLAHILRSSSWQTYAMQYLKLVDVSEERETELACFDRYVDACKVKLFSTPAA